MLSAASEDYLKAIYGLQAEGEGVTTQAVAGRLGVAAPSATAMLKKLAALKLLRHTPYYGVELTAAGEKIALEVIRHHRLVETYLAQVLGVPWDQVHDEADRWEHVISEEVEARIAAALNHPTHDPHGSPIPTHDGRIEPDQWEPLTAIPGGASATVKRVSDDDADVLRHLGEVGLVPNATVEVLRAVPSEGVLQLRIDGVQRIVGTDPAKSVFVERKTEKVS